MIAETSILIAILIGGAEVLKRLGISSKLIPAIVVLSGIGLALYSNYFESANTTFEGIIAGLTAIGLYAGGKTTLEAVKGAVKK